MGFIPQLTSIFHLAMVSSLMIELDTDVFGPLAQLAEQLTLNQQVTGSIPVRLTSKLKKPPKY